MRIKLLAKCTIKLVKMEILTVSLKSISVKFMKKKPSYFVVFLKRQTSAQFVIIGIFDVISDC